LMKISQKQNNIPKIFLIEVEICSKANILWDFLSFMYVIINVFMCAFILNLKKIQIKSILFKESLLDF
jgi:hypothetical protein